MLRFLTVASSNGFKLEIKKPSH